MARREYLEKDYYEVLGVGEDADADEIARAYRRLARRHHPDANPDDPGAEERFKEISEAHSVLSDPDQRAEYDRVRRMASSGAFTGGFPGAGPGGGPAGAPFGDGVDLGDLLGSMFGDAAGAEGPFGGRAGAARGQARDGRGRDLRAELDLSFEDAVAGVTTSLQVTAPAACQACRGSGAAPGTSPQACPTCGGSGTRVVDQGPFSIAQPCAECGGQGTIIAEPCSACRGQGRTPQSREVRVRIPAGVRDGAQIRLPGKGEAGVRGGPPGDLYVRVRVAAHEVFGRSGEDLTLDVPVTVAEAALGAEVTVPTLDGPVTLKVPAGTQTGTRLRVRGHGVPRRDGGRGDLICTVQVRVPERPRGRVRELLTELDAEQPGSALRADLERHAGAEGGARR